VKILIADDNDEVRSALSNYLRRSGDNWDVCGEVGDGRAAIQKANELRPDVVVLDLLMPIRNGIDAAREIHALLPEIHILIFTQIDPAALSGQAREAGIDAVVHKTQVSSLVREIRKAAAH
jgi:DNA-binding NarL/FixJ family response regulator